MYVITKLLYTLYSVDNNDFYIHNFLHSIKSTSIITIFCTSVYATYKLIRNYFIKFNMFSPA